MERWPHIDCFVIIRVMSLQMKKRNNLDITLLDVIVLLLDSML